MIQSSNADIYILWIYWWNVRQRFKIRFLLQWQEDIFVLCPRSMILEEQGKGATMMIHYWPVNKVASGRRIWDNRAPFIPLRQTCIALPICNPADAVFLTLEILGDRQWLSQSSSSSSFAFEFFWHQNPGMRDKKLASDDSFCYDVFLHSFVSLF